MEHRKDTYANKNGWLAGESQINLIQMWIDLLQNIVRYFFAKLWFDDQNCVHSTKMMIAMAMIQINGEVVVGR